MSKAYTKFMAFKDKLQKSWQKETPDIQTTNRLLIPAATLAEFPSQQDCDEFIKNKLIAHHFNMDLPIDSYKRVSDGAMLFEQESEVIGSES